jgi:hypothetical protein
MSLTQITQKQTVLLPGVPITTLYSCTAVVASARTAIGNSRPSSFSHFSRNPEKRGGKKCWIWNAIYLKVKHLHSVSNLMGISLSIMIRTVSDRKSKRYETFQEYTKFIRLAQKVFQVRASSYRVPDSSYLSGCTFESTFVCTVRVSIVRLFKYEHQHPPIITLLSQRWEHKANFETHDQACRLRPLAGPAGKN